MASTVYRKWMLWSALVATVLAALLVDDESEQVVDDVVQAVQPLSGSSGDKRTVGQTRETLPVDQLGKRKFSARADDIFSVTSWVPERIATDNSFNPKILQSRQEEVKRQLSTPSAPPLQFEYLGRVVAAGKTRVFLAQADQNYVAGAGERINAEYRVDRIREDAVELIYLPLGVRQTLLIN